VNLLIVSVNRPSVWHSTTKFGLPSPGPQKSTEALRVDWQ